MKKILFVTSHNPFTNTYGAEQRSHALLNAAINNGFAVDIAFIESAEGIAPPPCNPQTKIVIWGYECPVPKPLWKIRQDQILFNLYPTDPFLKAKIETLIKENNYALILCRYIQGAERAGLSKFAKRLILDIDDMPQQILCSLLKDPNIKLNGIKRIYTKIAYYKAIFKTKYWIKKSKIALLPNKEQADFWGTKYLPNIAINIAENVKHINNCKNILFIGRLDYPPNFNAIVAFVNNILPSIVRAIPESTLIVAGKGLPTNISKKWEDNYNVKYMGYVDNIQQFYNLGNIVICPIESGGGTNIKVIEAMSMGKACILTEFCTKGFAHIIQNKKNCYVAKDKEEFAENVIDILQNPDTCKNIQLQAFDTAKLNYSQETINKLFEKAIYQEEQL